MQGKLHVCKSGRPWAEFNECLKGHVSLPMMGDSSRLHYKVVRLMKSALLQMLATDQLDVASPAGSGRLQGPAPVVLCQALG